MDLASINFYFPVLARFSRYTGYRKDNQMKYEYSDKVMVTLAGAYERTGRIAGVVIGYPAIGRIWIVEDTSGDLPNEEYPYLYYVVPESMITSL